MLLLPPHRLMRVDLFLLRILAMMIMIPLPKTHLLYLYWLGLMRPHANE
jgi:hypothetical protein